jgi:hypothetical protein
MGEKRNTYRLLVGKREGKRPLGSPRCRWVDNIRMNLGDVGWGDVDWILSFIHSLYPPEIHIHRYRVSHLIKS